MEKLLGFRPREKILDRYQHRKDAGLPTSVHLRVLTWNMGNAMPPADLGALVPREWCDGEGSMLVVGLQESEYEEEMTLPADLPKARAAAYQGLSDFMKRMLLHLGDQTWGCFIHRSLGEMQLAIFAKQTLAPYLDNGDIARERTGKKWHIGDNKGGLSATFQLGSTSLNFVSAHLAAHQGG